MPHYKYLIVGGGMAAASAVTGIRELDEEGSIGLISAESDPPYNRPPLSKGLWKGKPVEKIWRATPERGVDLILRCEATSVDLQNRRVADAAGNDHAYEKLLLATGGTPRRLPFGGDHIIYFRTFQDYQRLKELADLKQRFAVIGGGFIGSELAASLKSVGKQVVMLFPEEGIGDRVFPAELARYLVSYYREQGVDVRPGELIAGLEPRGDQLVLKAKGGNETTVDAVVAGIGIQPNVRLAKDAGLNVGDGIVVDEHLRTSDPFIYAAGDVADFYNPSLDQRMRVEHEDNANTMGKMAGRAMAGDETPYHHLPMFYSDLFDLGYEAVGGLSSRLETLVDWQEPYKKGVIYYLGGGRVRGVLLWNVWDQVENARKLIQEGQPVTREALKGRLPA